MTNPKLLGDLVRAARKAKGLTQQELADLTGMSTGGIGMLESGRVDRPYPDTLRKLSKALDLTMEEMVQATGQLDPPSATRQDFTQERVEAEVHRIAAIPGTQAKLDELMRLSPALYDLVEAMVHDVIRESVPMRTQSAQPSPGSGKRHQQ